MTYHRNLHAEFKFSQIFLIVTSNGTDVLSG